MDGLMKDFPLAEIALGAYGRGVEAERERIIEVLRSDKAFDAVYYGDGGADEALAGLIALIRGVVE